MLEDRGAEVAEDVGGIFVSVDVTRSERIVEAIDAAESPSACVQAGGEDHGLPDPVVGRGEKVFVEELRPTCRVLREASSAGAVVAWWSQRSGDASLGFSGRSSTLMMLLGSKPSMSAANSGLAM